MKIIPTFIFIALTMTFYACVAIGQTDNDKQEILQKCIDLDELQQYYHENKVDGRKPLVIYNNGVVPTNINLTKFGVKVEFMNMEELFFYNKQAYLDFDKFEISSNEAVIQFHYAIEGLTVKIKLEKESDKWIIKKKELFEN